MTTQAPTKAPARPKRRLRRWLVAALLLLVIVAIAPTVVGAVWGQALIRDALIERFAADVKVDSVFASWLGARVGTLRIGQPAGFESVDAPLLELQDVRVEPSWGPLLSGRYDVKARIGKFTAAVARAADGSTNLQRVMRAPPRAASSSSPSASATSKSNANRLKLDFEVTNGSVLVRDAIANGDTRIEGIHVVARRPAFDAPLTFDLDMSITRKGAEPGRLQSSGMLDLTSLFTEARLEARHLDLSIASPFLASTGWIERAQGVVDGSMTLRYHPDGSAGGDGKITVRGLRLEGGRLAAPIVETTLEISPIFEWSKTRTRLDGLRVRASAFKLDGTGTFDAEKGGTASIAFDTDLKDAQETFAAFFPKRASLEGKATGSAKLATDAQGAPTLELQLAVSGFRATSASVRSAPLTDANVRLVGVATKDFSELTIREGTLSAGNVASGRVQGRWRRSDGISGIEGDAEISASLARAAERFGALLPAGMKLDGVIEAHASVEPAQGGETRATFDASAKDLRANALVESLLKLNASGSLATRSNRFQVDALDVQSASGSLTLHATASGSISDPLSTLQAKAHATGSLEKLTPWVARALPARLRLGGAVTADVDLRTDGGRVSGPVGVEVRNLSVAAAPDPGPPRLPDEPLNAWDRLERAPIRAESCFAGGKLELDRAAGTATLRDLSTRAGGVLETKGTLTLSLDGRRVEFQGRADSDLAPAMQLAAAYLPEGVRGTGVIGFDGKVRRDGDQLAVDGRVDARKLDLELARIATRLKTEGAVKTKVEHSPSATTFDLRAELATVEASRSAPGADAKPREFRDAKATLDAKGRLDRQRRHLDRTEIALALPESKLAATAFAEGAIDAGPWSVEFQSDSDLAPLSSLLAVATPARVDLEGRGTTRGKLTLTANPNGAAFDVSAKLLDFAAAPAGGRPLPPEKELTLEASGRFAWTSADVEPAHVSYALDLDRGVVKTRSGRLDLESNGKLRAGAEGFDGDAKGTLRGDLAFLASLAGSALPEGSDLGGRLESKFEAGGAGSTLRLAAAATVADFRFTPPPREGVASRPFTDSRLALDLRATQDRKTDQLVVESATLGTSDDSIRVTANGLTVRRLSTERQVVGEIVATLDGVAASKLAGGALPKSLSIEGPGRLTARLGGSLGDSPLATLTADGAAELPSLVFEGLRVEKTRAPIKLSGGVLEIEGAGGDVVRAGGDAASRGKFTLSGRAKLDDAARPFHLALRTEGIPAARELALPLAYVFPLFAGDFELATFDGSLDSQTTIEGEARDWKATTKGDISVNLRKVSLIARDDFAQVLKLLRLNALNSIHDSVQESLRIANGRIYLERIEVDGDVAKLPLQGSCSFNGDLEFGIDLGKARLSPSLERYRPILSLFSPTIVGTVKSPKFVLRAPTAERILQEATQLAAKSLLTGQRVDVSALTSIRSLDDLARAAEADVPAQPPAGAPPKSALPGVPPSAPGAPPSAAGAPPSAPGAPGSSNPAPPRDATDARFRALRRTDGRFDYPALLADASLAAELGRWLATAPAEPASDDARLADALNRYEAALALAAADELRNPIFAITRPKEGVHGIKGFFDRSTREIGGRRISLAALAAEIRKLGGDAAILSTPGAARDLPPIASTAYDAATVRKQIDAHAEAFLAPRVTLAANGSVSAPGFLVRAFGADDAALRALLKQSLPAAHPARGPIESGARITAKGDDLRLDVP